MNRNNILEPLLHILVLVILFGFPYTFVNSLDSVNWKMVANRVAVPVALCIVFYADYFLLVPKLLFKGRTGLWFQINIVLVLLTGVAMRLWQWYILPGDPGSHLPPGPEIIPRDSLRTNVEISFFIRDIALLSLVAGLSVAISYGKRWMQAENMRKEVESDSMISCETVNSCSTEKTSGSVSGIGLEQLARRLDILYPGRYDWTYGHDNEKMIYRSLLTIWKENPVQKSSGRDKCGQTDS